MSNYQKIKMGNGITLYKSYGWTIGVVTSKGAVLLAEKTSPSKTTACHVGKALRDMGGHTKRCKPGKEFTNAVADLVGSMTFADTLCKPTTMVDAWDHAS